LACLVKSFPAIPNMPWFCQIFDALLRVSLYQNNRGTQHTHNQHAQLHTQPSQPAPTTLLGSGEGNSICANTQGSRWRAMAVVAAPAAAVSIAVATATVSSLPILVDCCLCPRPSLLQPLLSPPTAVAVTVVVFVVIVIVVVLFVVVVVNVFVIVVVMFAIVMFVVLVVLVVMFAVLFLVVVVFVVVFVVFVSSLLLPSSLLSTSCCCHRHRVFAADFS
jgi:hypothetical protein